MNLVEHLKISPGDFVKIKYNYLWRHEKEVYQVSHLEIRRYNGKDIKLPFAAFEKNKTRYDRILGTFLFVLKKVQPWETEYESG